MYRNNDPVSVADANIKLQGAVCAADPRCGASECSFIHSRHTNTQKVTPSTRHSHLAHVTLASFKCSRTCNAYCAHRHGSESPHPGSTPGLNPCNHLARQACGPWRTHRYNTYIQARRQRRHEELMIHRNRKVAQSRRRDHHRAGGAGAVAVEAGTCYTYRHVSESNPPRKGHMYIPRTHCATMVAHGQAQEYMRPQ